MILISILPPFGAETYFYTVPFLLTVFWANYLKNVDCPVPKLTENPLFPS